jgi:hypothetical protein
MLFAGPGDDPDDPIDALLAVVLSNPPDDPDRAVNASHFVALALGDSLAGRSATDGAEPRAGSLLEAMIADGAAVPATEWAELARRRMRELADGGVDVRLLVRSVALYVTDWYWSLSSMTPEDAERREQTRQDLYALADDSDRFEQRKRLLPPDPAGRSDDELARASAGWVTGSGRGPRSTRPRVGRRSRGWERDSADLLR